ncbi:hypothetical protein SUGI_1100920 [Cryptomeria japonica]|nr:hypothetical protein SUGI_1100920 [Cryptomeria japonica]
MGVTTTILKQVIMPIPMPCTLTAPHDWDHVEFPCGIFCAEVVSGAEMAERKHNREEDEARAPQPLSVSVGSALKRRRLSTF